MGAVMILPPYRRQREAMRGLMVSVLSGSMGITSSSGKDLCADIDGLWHGLET